MTILWIASNNEHKRAELQRLLGPLGYEFRLQSDAPAAVEVVEDAPDFAGNAAAKAIALAIATGGVAIGDDSGLCVDALDGRPGVQSARYAGPGASDADRVGKLLGELEGVPPERRGARFVCHICLAGPRGEVRAGVEEACAGRIIDHPRGDGGFGYDPVFVADAHRGLAGAPTFAELTPEQKDAVSHRGQAVRQLVAYLQHHPLDGQP